jgi:hypothetical protein
MAKDYGYYRVECSVGSWYYAARSMKALKRHLTELKGLRTIAQALGDIDVSTIREVGMGDAIYAPYWEAFAKSEKRFSPDGTWNLGLVQG